MCSRGKRRRIDKEVREGKEGKEVRGMIVALDNV